MGRARCLRFVFEDALRHGRDCARHPLAFMPNPLVSLQRQHPFTQCHLATTVHLALQ